MTPLTLGTFIESWKDYEAGQYRVLAGLKRAREEFHHNRLYPTLAQLINLYGALVQIIHSTEGIRNELPKRIVGLDLKAHRILYESLSLNGDNVKAIEELIHWATPKIREAIEEGKTIYNFVEEQVALEEVGLLPSYVDEGYLLVPDLMRELIHVVRYEVSIFATAEEKYRNLKTRTVRSVPFGPGTTPWHIKQQLIAEQHDLPNPATYSFSVDIDFPFEETLLPVAKRKLLGRLYS